MDNPIAFGEIGRVGHSSTGVTFIGAAGFKKNELKPHLRKYWKIPPERNAAFVAQMEEILEIYHLPYNEEYPVVCFDESNKQLVGEVHAPVPCRPGSAQRMDGEYARNGVANILMEVEPLSGRRHVGITATRTRIDFAVHKEMLDYRYPTAKKVVLARDNLNTHNTASLYEAFPAPEAQRLSKRLEIHHTPKHGSWMNMAEIELSTLKGQCLNRRIPDMASLHTEVNHWQSDRNNKNSRINWQFTTAEARVKLKRLYPQL